MKRQLPAILAAAMTLAAFGQLEAQVGYPPHASPFQDLERTQEVSFFSGWYRAKLDPARVAPRSGPMVGVHYQWRASGPANLSVDLSRVESERRVLDPEQPATCATDPDVDCKLIGVFRWPLYFANLGLALDLTGARSFYRIVPELKLGVGVVSDFHTKADVGEFGFGTRFALNWGAGIRWVPGGPFQLRVDFTNYLYSLRYPETYYRPASDNTQIVAPRQSQSVWLNNPGLTIGLSYLFSR
jgi:hypothetical protein